jgi:cytochrome P450
MLTNKLPPHVWGLFWPGLPGHTGRHLLKFLLHTCSRYGDIYRLDFGFKQAIILNHPRHAQHMLRDRNANCVKGGDMTTPLRSVVGQGVMASAGALWRAQRRALQPFFLQDAVTSHAGLISNAIDAEMSIWHQAATTGAPLNMTQSFTRIVANITAQILFGVIPSVETIAGLSAALDALQQHLLAGLLRPRWPVWLPLPGDKTRRQTLAAIDRLVTPLIQRGQAGAPTPSLFAALQAQVQTVAGASAKQLLRDEVVSLFVAGYETTVSCLSWTLHLLCRHPTMLSRLQQEVDHRIGRRPPTAGEASDLAYMRMTLYESLRLQPPAWRISRVAAADDRIDGFYIPAGASVLLLVYALHRHPVFWPAPERFEPERFAPHATAARPPFTWLPFGAGARQCMGKELALLEAQLILASLLQRFTPQALSCQAPEVQFAITLKPRTGVWVRLAPRQTPTVHFPVDAPSCAAPDAADAA